MADGSASAGGEADVSRRRIDRLVDRATRVLMGQSLVDEAAIRMLTKLYFPLSRGWAALLAADGARERFREALRVRRLSGPFADRAVALAQVRQRQLAAAEARWERAFFGDDPGLAEAEATRLAAAKALMGLRATLAPLHMTRAFPGVRFEIDPIAAVAARHGRRLGRPEQAFAAPLDLTAIEASRGFLTHRGVQGWLRWPSPVRDVGDIAWAKVLAPARRNGFAAAGVEPTLVFAHGIGMEPEFAGEIRRGFDHLLAGGVRVVRAEAPWHGRRRLSGWYGGEPLLGRGVGGLIDFFHAHAIELGQLVAWARATRGGPVAVGGVSLGALTAQMVATVARHWPPEMRPDAVFLVAPSLSVIRVAFEGALTRGMRVPSAITAAGWTGDDLERWAPLFEPLEPPALDPERVVIVLGATDTVTLTSGGEALARAWGLPEQNVFRAPAGHFTTAMSIAGDPASIARLLAVLEQASGVR